MKRDEHQEQKAFFQWVNLMQNKMPALKLCYAIPNANKRTIAQAMYLKHEGMTAGIFDISLDWPSKGFHGLKIEMKVGKNKLTPSQKHFKELYEAAGYQTKVCYSAQEAIETVLEYLN